MSDIKIPIPGRLTDVSTDNVVAGANEIFDDNKNKRQSEINVDVDNAVLAEQTSREQAILAEKNRAEAAETALSTRVSDVEQLEQISLDGGTAQIATGEDFVNPDVTKRAKVVTVGAILDGADDEPTAGSENLVKSGGIVNYVSSIPMEVYVYNENGPIIYNGYYITFPAGTILGYKERNVGQNKTITFSEDTTFILSIDKKLVIRNNEVLVVANTTKILPTDILLYHVYKGVVLGGALYSDYLKNSLNDFSSATNYEIDILKNQVFRTNNLYNCFSRKGSYVSSTGEVIDATNTFFAAMFIPKGTTIKTQVYADTNQALLSLYDYNTNAITVLETGKDTTTDVSYTATENDVCVVISGRTSSSINPITVIKGAYDLPNLLILSLCYYIRKDTLQPTFISYSQGHGFISEPIKLKEGETITFNIAAGIACVTLSKFSNNSYTPLFFGNSDHAIKTIYYVADEYCEVVISGDYGSLSDLKIIEKAIEGTERIFKLTQGAISAYTGLYPTTNQYIIGTHAHTPKYIKFPGLITITNQEDISGYIVFYNSNMVYLRSEVIDSTHREFTDYEAKYFRIVLTPNTDLVHSLSILSYWSEMDKPIEIFGPMPADEGYQNITFGVNISTNQNYRNTGLSIIQEFSHRSIDHGVLHLPPTYTPDGDGTPLIIYLHGAAERYSISSKRFGGNVRYSPEWSAAGYAQLDVNMIPDLYGYTDAGSCGTGDDTACVEAAYQWVIEHYNIRRDGIYLFGRSRGGQAVLSILGRYNPKKLPIICALSNTGANDILLYGLRYRMSSAWWAAFCTSMGLPVDERPELDSSKVILTDANIASYLRDNIDIWWEKSKVALALLVENTSNYQTPLEIFNLIVDACNNVSGKRAEYDNFLRSCKFSSPVPLRFDWCVGDTIQKYSSFPSTWTNGFGVSVMEGFLGNKISGNAVYREWPSVPEGDEAHYHEKFNLLNVDYTLPNGAVVSNGSMAQIEWLLWAQSFDQRRISGCYNN